MKFIHNPRMGLLFKVRDDKVENLNTLDLDPNQLVTLAKSQSNLA